MKKVKLGIIGLGNIGQIHLKNVATIDNIDLVAVCDIDRQKAFETASLYKCKAFEDYQVLFNEGLCDAVLIATPHYSHTTIGIAALERGLHVLVEKPISVHKLDCERLLAAQKNKNQVFAAMFNQRTDPTYKKIKELICNGELGNLQRVNWTITDWFRTEAYYKSGTWRATWKGEGGGVLLNQCPHQLDMLQWLFGMPAKVTAFCHLGKKHNIEVEDEVTAYLEYPKAYTAVFITSTGEFPGTNRLEIASERGKVIAEGGNLTFYRNEVEISKFSQTTKEIWGHPDMSEIKIPVAGSGGQHKEVLENFARAVLYGEKLIAPGEEGIFSVELANSMIYSSMTGKTVELPLDGNAFQNKLNQLVNSSQNTRGKCKV